MSIYVSGAVVLADARMRLRRLGNEFGNEYGILVVEGSDDSKLFQRHAARPELILPCGGKPLLLDAFSVLRPTEDARIVFIVDCDYDAPLRRLPLGAKNLIVTTHPALETDLFSLPEVAEAIAEQLVSSEQLEEFGRPTVAEALRERTVALSDAMGRIRWVAATHRLKLNFGIDLSQFRRSDTSLVDEEALLAEVLRKSGAVSMSSHQIRQAAVDLDRGLISCRGHDIVDALADVLHRDFGVNQAKCKVIPEVLRMAITSAHLDELQIITRLRSWETANGRTILK